MKRRERDGHVWSYRVTLDRARVGFGFTVFVGVRIEGHANHRAGGFEVGVPDLAHYQKLLIGKLLALSMVRDVRSSIAIDTLKAVAPLPFDHLGAAQSSSNSRSAT